LLFAGSESSGLANNRNGLKNTIKVESTISELLQSAFFDPQTSGPLLIALPKSEVDVFSAAMKERELDCWIIGQVSERGEYPLVIS